MSTPEDQTRPRRFRNKLPELLIEGASVAFAVLLALFVDQWRENRSNTQLAQRAEESIMAEVRTNLERLHEQAGHRDSLLAYTRDMRQALVDEETLTSIDVNFTPALMARTAWETAQVTRALHFMDYDRVARIGRIYEVQKLYEEAESSLIRTLSGIGQLNWEEPVAAIDVIIPSIGRVDTFGDMLTLVYEHAEKTGFGADAADSLPSPEPAASPAEGGPEKADPASDRP